MIWRSFKDRPNTGTSVVAMHYHSKRQGWRSVELLGGVAEYWSGPDGKLFWMIWNNDDRGNGSETWKAGEDFQWWAYEVDMPELPKEVDNEKM